MIISEAAFQTQVRQLCRQRRLAVYHTHNSERSDPGWPDLAILGSNGMLFRELKREDGRVTPEQKWYLEQMAAAGMDVGVWRPSQLSTDVQRELSRLRPLEPAVWVAYLKLHEPKAKRRSTSRR